MLTDAQIKTIAEHRGKTSIVFELISRCANLASVLTDDLYANLPESEDPTTLAKSCARVCSRIARVELLLKELKASSETISLGVEFVQKREERNELKEFIDEMTSE